MCVFMSRSLNPLCKDPLGHGGWGGRMGRVGGEGDLEHLYLPSASGPQRAGGGWED